MATGYCEAEDVREALQETSLDGPINTTIVEASIVGVSDWLRRTARSHWYDSGGSTSKLVDTGPRTATNVRLDVPSSPHATDRQIHRAEDGVRYPVTRSGPYAKVRLPHRHVGTLNALKVRDRDGDVEDWTSTSDKVQGVGEDYYIQTDGSASYGRTYLYIRAAAIGGRTDFEDLLTLDYDYGLDAASDDWDVVRRGVAMLAAADVVDDDDVVTAIDDSGQLVSLDSKAQRLADTGKKYLDTVMSVPTA